MMLSLYLNAVLNRILVVISFIVADVQVLLMLKFWV